MRVITPQDFASLSTDVRILDVRRKDDYDASDSIVTGAEWKDPTDADNWIQSLSKDNEIIIYCVRGGGVSNSVVDKLQSAGFQARYIEGGIVALEEAGMALGSKA